MLRFKHTCSIIQKMTISMWFYTWKVYYYNISCLYSYGRVRASDLFNLCFQMEMVRFIQWHRVTFGPSPYKHRFPNCPQLVQINWCFSNTGHYYINSSAVAFNIKYPYMYVISLSLSVVGITTCYTCQLNILNWILIRFNQSSKKLSMWYTWKYYYNIIVYTAMVGLAATSLI